MYAKKADTGGIVVTRSRDIRGWLWFAGVLLVALPLVWLVESEENTEIDDDVTEVSSSSSIADDTYVPSAPSMSLIELARSRYASCQDPERYCSEYTVIETYELAVREDPENFDEASEVFSSFLGSETRSAVYLRVMRAYVNLIGIHPAAVDNYLIVFDAWTQASSDQGREGSLDDWDIDQAFYGFTKAWDQSGGDERLLHKAVDFEKYFEFAIVHDNNFDATQRYTTQNLEAIIGNGGEDPFWCSGLAERIEHLLWIAEIRNDNIKVRKWKLHMADYYVTLHICEDGYPAPEPEKAYALYTELGMKQEAQDAAWKVVTNDANVFVFGGDVYAPWRELPEPCDTDVLAHMLLWYPRTGVSAEEQKEELHSFAEGSERVGYLDAALKIYELLEDYDQVARLRPMAEAHPRPDEMIQLEHFFTRLEAAEANKYPQHP